MAAECWTLAVALAETVSPLVNWLGRTDMWRGSTWRRNWWLEKLVYTQFESWISVLSSDLTRSSSGRSVSPVCRVPSEEVWLQGSQRVFRPGIHGEAQWGWNTKRHNWCCAVGLENRHYSNIVFTPVVWIYKVIINQMQGIFHETVIFCKMSRSNCVVCLCPDKKDVLQQACNVLKVRLNISTNSFKWKE